MISSEPEMLASFHLNSMPVITSTRYQALIINYGSARAAVNSHPSQWIRLPEFDHKAIDAAKTQGKEAAEKADLDLCFVKEHKIHVKLWQREDYPANLKHIYMPPPVLFIQGCTEVVEELSIAMVGSRRSSYYGERVAKRLASDLAHQGVATISGLARGIDRSVHEGSLEAGGKTIAVLGSGLGRLYPKEHLELSNRIAKQGAVLSEFPVETDPFPSNFPRRNRIIAGLSLATVIVEGSQKSGSLITAKLAADQGKEVLAVPGPILSPNSVAPNGLIKSGAKLVEDVEDILEEVPALKERVNAIDQNIQTSQEVVFYKEILEFIGSSPTPKEALADRIGMSAGDLSALILDLELKGLIRSLPGGYLEKIS